STPSPGSTASSGSRPWRSSRPRSRRGSRPAWPRSSSGSPGSTPPSVNPRPGRSCASSTGGEVPSGGSYRGSHLVHRSRGAHEARHGREPDGGRPSRELRVVSHDVALLEDEAELRELLSEVLEARGHRVRSFATVHEAA